MLRPSTSTFSATSNFRISSWTNCAPGSAATDKSCGCGWLSTPARRFCPSFISVCARKTRRICSSTPYDGSWPPFCLPLFTSDGFNVYFYALTAHFGQWLEGRRGRKARQWQGAAGLIYGQVKKNHPRRKLMQVTPVIPLWSQDTLQNPSQRLPFPSIVNPPFLSH